MATTANQPLSESTARAAFDRFGSAWVDGDMSGVEELFADDVTYHVPPFPDMGKAELLEFIAGFRAGFHDFELSDDEDVVAGSTSVHRWHCAATFAGKAPLLPVEPTGRHTTASGNLMFHWSDGKVTEAWHFGDWMGWLTQAGVLPPLAP
jgi:ketosteroid isomerase-like protein